MASASGWPSPGPIVRQPKILIADEPTGNLDPKHAWDVIKVLEKINKFGTTVLLTTHNQDIVNTLKRRVVTIKDGKIVSDRALSGSTGQLGRVMKGHRLFAFERIIKNGFVSFGRNIWLAIAAIAMMGITLTILLFAVVANATFKYTIDALPASIDVSIYLKDSVSPQQRDDLISQVRNSNNVKSVTYISKDQALKTYEAQNANDLTCSTLFPKPQTPTSQLGN